MNKKLFIIRNREVLLGIVSLLGLIILFTAVNNFKLEKASAGSREYKAQFLNIEGIKVGSNVRYSGINVGDVSDVKLNPDYTVEVTIKVGRGFDIPVDSTLMVLTDGILGSKYLEISAGSEDEYLKSGDSFENTTESTNIIGLVKQVLHRVKVN